MFTSNQQSVLTASLVTALAVFMCILLAIGGAVFYSTQVNQPPEFTGIKVTTSSSRSSTVTTEYGTAPSEVVSLFNFCFSTSEVEQIPESLGGTLIRTTNEYVLTREADGVMMTLTAQPRCNPATQWGIQKLVIDNDDISTLYMYEWIEASNR